MIVALPGLFSYLFYPVFPVFRYSQGGPGVSLTLCCFVVYSTRRFVVCLSMCHFVLVFFSPFSIAITSLGEERANLSAFRTFVRFVLVWICRFPLPLGVWEGLRFVIVALPGLFSYLFFYLRNTSSISSKTAYSNICKTVQTRLRDMQGSWLRKKADEIQSFADRKDTKKFFDALKTVYGPQSSGTTPVLSADGTSLLIDKEAILKRWAEHFDGVLNRPTSINDEAINRLPQVECNPLLDELPIVSETVKAIKPVIWQGSRIRYNTCRGLQSRRSSSCRETDSYFTLCGEKKPSFKNSRMQQLSTYSKGKEILKSVTIIEASLYCQLLGRSLLVSY